MYKKSPQGWLKHWDFILLDIFCLQLAFVVAYLVRQGLENPYSDQIYRTVAFVFMLCQIVVMFLGQSYQDILKRGYYIEFTKTVKHVLMVMLLSVLYLFATQQAVSYSRLTLFYTAFLYLCFDYVGRVWHKENVLKKNATKKKEKSMVVVVSLAEAKETIEKILSAPIQNFSINGIALIDDNPGVKEIAGIPVVGNMDTISEYLCHEWVDEVFVKISETEPYPQKLIDEIIIMGLTVHLSLGEMEKSLSGKNFIEKIGGYSVITSSINTASPKQLLYKRLMDIAGGIVGCLLTVILIVVIGPMIYIKSPGPIFFSQVRIGKNGKKFKIYKFRSMYMDAEERKAELMSQNKMEGLMFKMDYDPRIIGSEKKDKNGNPKPISEQQAEDKKIIGNGLPKHLLSWDNSFTFKNFDLGITMRGAFDYDILNYPRMFYECPVNLTRGNLLATAYEPKYGKTVLNDQQELQYVSYFIERGNFWKIDNITIGYTLKLKNDYLKRIRIYATGNNLFTFTGYSGLDPEVNTQGLNPGCDELGRYPSTRSFTLGAMFTF
mgnify:CR=1 FL=1